MRVLLIEDDSATAQSIELMLQSEGFNCYTTDLGEEGVDLGKLYDYDIILLDLNLPDIDGRQICRTLRTDPDAIFGDEPPRVLMLTARDALEDREIGHRGQREAGEHDRFPADLVG